MISTARTRVGHTVPRLSIVSWTDLATSAARSFSGRAVSVRSGDRSRHRTLSAHHVMLARITDRPTDVVLVGNDTTVASSRAPTVQGRSGHLIRAQKTVVKPGFSVGNEDQSGGAS